MQTVSPKLQDKIVDMLVTFAGNKNRGADEAINAYCYIRRATWHELQGRFTRAEATALVDMYNGTLLSPDMQYQVSVLAAQVEDSEKYDATCSRHGASAGELLEKVRTLTAAQVFILQQELVRAWENNLNDGKAIDKAITHLSEPDNFL